MFYIIFFILYFLYFFFFFSSRRRHTRYWRDWSSDVCCSDLAVRPRSAIPRQSRGVGDLRAPLVGRERELRLLLDVFGRVAEDRQTHLFTMVGNAGIGKSRLVEEALARMATEFRPRILQGHCLPYGEGITYWPVIEILR